MVKAAKEYSTLAVVLIVWIIANFLLQGFSFLWNQIASYLIALIFFCLILRFAFKENFKTFARYSFHSVNRSLLSLLCGIVLAVLFFAASTFILTGHPVLTTKQRAWLFVFPLVAYGFTIDLLILSFYFRKFQEYYGRILSFFIVSIAYGIATPSWCLWLWGVSSTVLVLAVSIHMVIMCCFCLIFYDYSKSVLGPALFIAVSHTFLGSYSPNLPGTWNAFTSVLASAIIILLAFGRLMRRSVESKE